jgi:hypothetical protein
VGHCGHIETFSPQFSVVILKHHSPPQCGHLETPLKHWQRRTTKGCKIIPQFAANVAGVPFPTIAVVRFESLAPAVQSYVGRLLIAPVSNDWL